MIRLILLLLGAAPLIRLWWVFVLLSAGCLLASFIFIDDLFDSAIIVTTDVIGVLFVAEGVGRLLTLAAIGFPNATVPVLKSLGFFVLVFLAIDVPGDDNIVATVVLGAALLIDGLFRLAAAALIRSTRWRQAVLVGLIELVMAGLVWAPWPVPHRHTVPFCLGVGLLCAAWSLCRLGFQLRRLLPGASVTDLPLAALPSHEAFQLHVQTLGRLTTPAQFADIILKTDGQGHVKRACAMSAAWRSARRIIAPPATATRRSRS